MICIAAAAALLAGCNARNATVTPPMAAASIETAGGSTPTARAAKPTARAAAPTVRAARPIAPPERALLVPQPEPVCYLSDPAANERQRLDYERQCYRQAEMIARNRLRLLQDAVASAKRAR